MHGASKTGNILFLCLVAAVASSTFATIKIAAASFDPYQITFWRTLIALLACLPFLRGRASWRQLQRRHWMLIVAISVVGMMIPSMLLGWAGGKIDSALVGILWSTLPLFGVTLSHLLTQNDRIGLGKVAGVLLGMTSVYLLTGYDLNGQDWRDLGPHFAIIAAAFCYAVSGVLQARLPHTLPGVQIAALMMGASAVLTLVLFPLGDMTLDVDAGSVAALFYLGVVTTALLAYLRLVLIRRAGYSLVSCTGFLIPVFSMLIGVLLLGESVPRHGFIALALGLVAIFLMQFTGQGSRRNR